MEKKPIRGTADVEDAMRRHGGAVYMLAFARTRSQADAQDVAQDVFLSLLTCGKSFKDEEHLRAWLLRATINRCNDLFRSGKVREVPVEEVPCDAEVPGPEDMVLRELESSRVWKALTGLSEPLRDAAVLHYVQELPVREVARILGCRQGTVRVRLARAREQMRAALSDEGEQGERGVRGNVAI